MIVHGRISGNGRTRNWITATFFGSRTGVSLSNGRWSRTKHRKRKPRVDIRCLVTGLSNETKRRVIRESAADRAFLTTFHTF